jgi:simple sugar transport system permease protein
MALTPLIFTGLAVGFAFRTGLFNIGVEGSLLVVDLQHF